MLDVSSLLGAFALPTLVGFIAACRLRVDVSNDRTDGQFRRLEEDGCSISVLQGRWRSFPQ